MKTRNRMTEIARDLRRRQTPAEIALWGLLRNRQCHGLKFRRQVAVGTFVIDFLCSDSHLAIEVDGGIHQEPKQVASDSNRDAYLREHGYTVIRFANEEILGNPAGVIAVLERRARRQPSPPAPLPKGEGRKTKR